MSGPGFHLHAPRLSELVRAAQNSHEAISITTQIALVTAIIAILSLVFAHMGGTSQTHAGIYKNNATVKKAEASSQWSDFQLKSTKQSLTEFARDLEVNDQKAAYLRKIERYEKEKNDLRIGNYRLQPEALKDSAVEEQIYQNHRWVQAEFARDLAIDAKRTAYQNDIARYEKEKNEIKTRASQLEAEALKWDKASDAQIRQHQRWAQASTVLQVSIALAAIALLARKKWLVYAMFVLAGIGVMLGGLAAMHI